MKFRNYRALYPAIPASTHKEAIRAGLGALIGLGIAGFVLSFFDLHAAGLYLIAPFGASSVLLFAVPNSPLAQPWSAIVGNSVAALAGVAVCYVIPDPVLRGAAGRSSVLPTKRGGYLDLNHQRAIFTAPTAQSEPMVNRCDRQSSCIGNSQGS